MRVDPREIALRQLDGGDLARAQRVAERTHRAPLDRHSITFGTR